MDWLLGRIAAKDAVRDWLRQHKGMLLHPLEVEIANQPDGAPRLLIPSLPSLAISIAHIERRGHSDCVPSAGGRRGPRCR